MVELNFTALPLDTEPAPEPARPKLPPPPPPPRAEATPEPEHIEHVKPPTRNANGTFGIGHTFAKGNPRLLPTPDDVLDAGKRYLKWCDDCPYSVRKTTLYKGKPITYDEEATRIPSVNGFIVWLGITGKTLSVWSHHPEQDYADAVKSVKEMILATQIELGANRVLDPGFTARVAGLVEKHAIETNAPPPALTFHPDDIPNKVHPDDPNPYDEDPLMFSQRQLDAGVMYPAKVVNHD